MKLLGSLTIVGLGITPGQTTIETIGAIKSARHLVALTDNPATLAWLETLHPQMQSLRSFYSRSKPRSKTYEDIVEHFLQMLRQGRRVCFALYGHPAVFARPAHELIRRARQEGFPARMLPGISAEDCLFADLNIDPGHGCQSYEATDFLLRRRPIDPFSALILWQIAVIGQTYCPGRTKRNNLSILAKTLRDIYPRDHQVTLYMAAMFPGCPPTCDRVALYALASAPVHPMSTLFVPALDVPPPDKQMLRRLGMA
jgi:uncharacterized protein YabN with tetrapyrrole methylase and pyrophosphatase domain